jgi:hypothetical protein
MEFSQTDDLDGSKHTFHVVASKFAGRSVMSLSRLDHGSTCFSVPAVVLRACGWGILPRHPTYYCCLKTPVPVCLSYC